MNDENSVAKEKPRWLNKDGFLFALGSAAIIYEVFLVGILNQVFHFEVLLAGLALVGIPIAQWADKK